MPNYPVAIDEAFSLLDGRSRTAAAYLYSHKQPACSSLNATDIFLARKLLSESLNVPFASIYLAGSAQIDWSISSRRGFDSQKSDLDFAVVSAHSYQKGLETAIEVTRGFTDTSKFRDIHQKQWFTERILKGQVFPESMPFCRLRTQWTSINQKLATACAHIAQSASFAIYLSEPVFIGKQASLLNRIRSLP